MLLVFEGADAAGKTTLAAIVNKLVPGSIYIHGVPFNGWCEEAHRGMLNAAMRHISQGRLVCMDRNWPSEFIYGPVFRNKPDYNNGAELGFDHIIRQIGAYVLCVPRDKERQVKRWEEGRENGKFEHFPKVREIIDLYADLYMGNPNHKGIYYLDECIRHGGFADNNCYHYDIDVDGRDAEKFAKFLIQEVIQ